MNEVITNKDIWLGFWTIVIELNNYSDNIIYNAEDINDLSELKNKYYGADNVDRIRYFDKNNYIHMYKEF